MKGVEMWASVSHCFTLKSDSSSWCFSQRQECECGDAWFSESKTRDFFLRFSCGEMAASIKMQGPGAFVFSFFDYKLVLMPVIIMYVNLFSFSTNKVWSFGVAAHSTAPRERVWRATVKVPGFKFKVHKNEFVSAGFSKTCQHTVTLASSRGSWRWGL